MAVKIVTDSSSDIPAEIVENLDITVVPCNVHFGTQGFKDGVDLQADEFYQRLIEGSDFPKTSQPSPGDLKQAYDDLGAGADGIVSVHVSSKLSATYNSAIQAKGETSAECPVDVVDSYQACLGLGMVVIAAAEVANRGGTHGEVASAARSAVDRAQLIFLLDTLEYLQKGGRIGKARAMLGSVLRIKPLIILREGVVDQLGRARSVAKGMAKLREVAEGFSPLESVSVPYTTTPDLAQEFADSLSDLLPEGKKPFVARAGPTIGTYAGPGAFGIGLLQAEGGPGQAKLGP